MSQDRSLLQVQGVKLMGNTHIRWIRIPFMTLVISLIISMYINSNGLFYLTNTGEYVEIHSEVSSRGLALLGNYIDDVLCVSSQSTQHTSINSSLSPGI